MMTRSPASGDFGSELQTVLGVRPKADLRCWQGHCLQRQIREFALEIVLDVS